MECHLHREIPSCKRSDLQELIHSTSMLPIGLVLWHLLVPLLEVQVLAVAAVQYPRIRISQLSPPTSPASYLD